MHSVIPISQVSLLDDMVIVCGALTNLCKSVEKREYVVYEISVLLCVLTIYMLFTLITLRIVLFFSKLLINCESSVIVYTLL